MRFGFLLVELVVRADKRNDECGTSGGVRAVLLGFERVPKSGGRHLRGRSGALAN